MIIGTATDLRALAREIEMATENADEVEDSNWPRLIVTVRMGKGSAFRADYKVSFHIESTSGRPEVPLIRRFNVVPWLWILGVTGLIVAVRFILHACGG